MSCKLCREVNEGCLPPNNNYSGKTMYNLQLTSAWIRSGVLHSPFLAILHDKRYSFSVYATFSDSIYRAGGSVYEVSYPCMRDVMIDL